jgi:hypothetical protein
MSEGVTRLVADLRGIHDELGERGKSGFRMSARGTSPVGVEGAVRTFDSFTPSDGHSGATAARQAWGTAGNPVLIPLQEPDHVISDDTSHIPAGEWVVQFGENSYRDAWRDPFGFKCLSEGCNSGISLRKQEQRPRSLRQSIHALPGGVRTRFETQHVTQPL